MRASRSQLEHQAAVSRRLAQLSAELAAARVVPPVDRPGGAPDTHTRIRPDRIDSPYVPAPPEPPGLRFAEPGEMPSVTARVSPPGRHAARRRITSRWAPASSRLFTARSQVGFGPTQLTLVAVVVAIACAVTTWWLLRAAPVGEPVAVRARDAQVSPVSVVHDSVPAPDVDPAAAAPSSEVVVDVAGKVRRPGIVVLPLGSRVVDALKAAGGARPRVDLSSLNLARRLVDGEQLLVGLALPGGSAAEIGSAAEPAPGGLVNLNRADQSQLEALPEIGPVTAQAILAFRQEHGGFSSIDELLDVDGIGDATLSKLAPLVTI